MDQDAESAKNSLPAGIALTDIQAAIARSGYPLQLKVAQTLRTHFENRSKWCSVREEWHFRDGGTQKSRTLDIAVECPLVDLQSSGDARVRPALTLLVECKRSEMPYVFFCSERALRAPQFPAIAGLSTSGVAISTDDDPSTWHLDVLDSLGLEGHPFVTRPPFSCTTFSKCVRRGKELELSGSEAFSGIVMPLLSALSHYLRVSGPPKTARYYDCSIVVPLAVVDAPIVVSQLRNAGMHMTQTSWVRVFRHQSKHRERWDHYRDVFALDIVDRAFLPTYLETHVAPFADEFCKRARKHHLELASGKGFAPGMGKLGWGGIEERLRPKR